MNICTSEECIGSHGTTVIDGCELSCGSWELNSGPLKEQRVLLTPEPSIPPIPSTKVLMSPGRQEIIKCPTVYF